MLDWTFSSARDFSNDSRNYRFSSSSLDITRFSLCSLVGKALVQKSQGARFDSRRRHHITTSERRGTPRVLLRKEQEPLQKGGKSLRTSHVWVTLSVVVCAQGPHQRCSTLRQVCCHVKSGREKGVDAELMQINPAYQVES